MKENIFSDLYNKVMNFFMSTQNEGEATKGVAINRLKSVLMQDRAGFSERAMQMMKDEMIECIAKYMEIDKDSFDLQLDPRDDSTVLNLSIPVIRPKTDEEIDKAIEECEKKAQEKAQAHAKEIVQELEEIIEEKAQELAGTISKDSSEEDSDEEINEETEEFISEEEKITVEEINEEDELTDKTQKEITSNPFEPPQEDAIKKIKNKKN